MNDEREQGMVENRKTAIKNKVLEMGGLYVFLFYLAHGVVLHELFKAIQHTVYHLLYGGLTVA